MIQARSIDLEYADVPLTVDFEFDPGEPAITSGPSDHWHPGSAPMAIVTAVKPRASSHDIINLLNADTIASIEQAIVVKLEG